MERLSLGLLAIACVVFLASSTGFAQKYQQGDSWGFSYAVASFDYQEPDMEQDGVLHGIAVNYFQENKYNLFASFSLDYLTGKVDYHGETISTGTPVETSGRNHLIKGNAIAGKRYGNKKTIWRPYIGFGTRYWVDHQEETGNVSTYEREITYYYSPMGMMFSRRLTSGWNVRVDLRYNLFWQGRARANDFMGDQDLEMDQDFLGGHGFEPRVCITREFGDYDLSVSPYISYWDVWRSDLEQLDGRYYYEPENETLVWGTSFTVSF